MVALVILGSNMFIHHNMGGGLGSQKLTRTIGNGVEWSNGVTFTVDSTLGSDEEVDTRSNFGQSNPKFTPDANPKPHPNVNPKPHPYFEESSWAPIL